MSEPQSIFLSAGEASGEHYGAQLIDVPANSPPLASTPASSAWAARRWSAPASAASSAPKTSPYMGITEVLRHAAPHLRAVPQAQSPPSERSAAPPSPSSSTSPTSTSASPRTARASASPSSTSSARSSGPGSAAASAGSSSTSPACWSSSPSRAAFYRARGVDAEFVGHPARRPAPAHHHPRALRRRSTTSTPPSPGSRLLPGSRWREIRRQPPRPWSRWPALPSRIGSRIQRLRVHPPRRQHHRPDRRREFVAGWITCEPGQASPASALPSSTSSHDARAALYHARASVVASGTATVQAALIGNPFVVVYRVSPSPSPSPSASSKSPTCAMANLIAGKRVSPSSSSTTSPPQISSNTSTPCYPTAPLAQSMMQELAGNSPSAPPAQLGRDPDGPHDRHRPGRRHRDQELERFLGAVARMPCNPEAESRDPPHLTIRYDVDQEHADTNGSRCRHESDYCPHGHCSSRSPHSASAGSSAARRSPAVPAARPARRARPLNITGYVIDAELDPATHHLTATAPVTFTAPDNLDVVTFGFHPALKITNITDDTGKLARRRAHRRRLHPRHPRHALRRRPDRPLDLRLRRHHHRQRRRPRRGPQARRHPGAHQLPALSRPAGSP